MNLRLLTLTMPGLRELEALRAFVETGSVSRAADRLCRTQPQVGRILTRLEQELGFALFDRSTRPLSLTREGRDYYMHATQVLSARDSLVRYADQARRNNGPHVKIFTTPFIANTIVIDPIWAMQAAGAAVNLSIDSRVHMDVDAWVANEVFDIGVVGFPTAHPAFEIEPFITVEAMVAVSAEHRFARQASVRFDELAEENLILLNPRSRVRRHLERLAAEASRPINSNCEVHNGLIACQMASRGLGCCLSDPFIASGSGAPGLVLRRFEPMLKIDYAFYYPNWQPRSRLTQEIAAAIAQHARTVWDDVQAKGAAESGASAIRY